MKKLYQYFNDTLEFFRMPPRLDYIPLITSVPKNGTNLLIKAIHLLIKQPERYISNKKYNDCFTTLSPKAIDEAWRGRKSLKTHLIYNEQNINIIKKYPRLKNFFILRDPRDQLISHCHWI